MADALPTKINLTVVTRERKIVETDVDEVELPASDGEIGILPGHTPLLAMLRIGQMRYRTGTTVMRLVLSWGFAEVLPDRVIVMAEAAPGGSSSSTPVAAHASAHAAQRLTGPGASSPFGGVERRKKASKMRAIRRSSVSIERV